MNKLGIFSEEDKNLYEKIFKKVKISWKLEGISGLSFPKQCFKMIIPIEKMLYFIEKDRKIYKNLVTPFQDINYIETYYNNNCKEYKELLRQSLYKYFNSLPFQWRYKDLYSAYVLTVYNWLDKYDIDDILLLSKIFSTALDSILFNIDDNRDPIYMDIRCYRSLSDMDIFIFTEGIKENKIKLNNEIYDYICKSFQNKLYRFSECPEAKIFYDSTIYKKLKNKEKYIKEYIEAVGIDIYKTYVRNSVVFKNDLNGYIPFQIQCQYYFFMNKIDLEIYAMFFAEENYLDKFILQRLQEVNSIHVDKYSSLLLMKELIE